MSAAAPATLTLSDVPSGPRAPILKLSEFRGADNWEGQRCSVRHAIINFSKGRGTVCPRF